VRRRRAQAVDRQRRAVVEPDDRLTAVVDAWRRVEAAGRRRALVRRDLVQRAVAEARHGVIAARQPDQRRRGPGQAAVGVEDEQPRLLLVEDREWAPAAASIAPTSARRTAPPHAACRRRDSHA
jgi:hypothetical protein